MLPRSVSNRDTYRSSSSGRTNAAIGSIAGHVRRSNSVMVLSTIIVAAINSIRCVPRLRIHRTGLCERKAVLE